MGDWGGKPDKPYTTEEQIITAQGMEKRLYAPFI